MLTVVNLTTHAVSVHNDDGVVASWEPSGDFARLVERRTGRGHLDGHPVVPVVGVWYADSVEGLPDLTPGTVYIVSRVLAAAVRRHDLYFPFGEVRDAEGRIIGCRALGQFHQPAEGDDDA